MESSRYQTHYAAPGNDVLAQYNDFIDIGTAFLVDKNVLRWLPKGTVIVHAEIYGASVWTRAAKVTAQLPDGKSQELFMKMHDNKGGTGAIMMEGEHASMKRIYEVVPESAPKPYGWGRFCDNETYFILLDFIDIDMQLPSIPEFCEQLAKLHRDSVSPTGKFGYDLPVLHGKAVQPPGWYTSWCECFTKLLGAFYEGELAANGKDPELESKFDILCREVIPRLLKPLQENGRVVKPCLVHGNLWEENSGTNLETEQPLMYDACSLYAHHEYEMGMWRRKMVRFHSGYINRYYFAYPPDEPVDEWDDRQRLYSLKFNIAHSISWRDGTRASIIDDMTFLIDKYSPDAIKNQSTSSKADFNLPGRSPER